MQTLVDMPIRNYFCQAWHVHDIGRGSSWYLRSSANSLGKLSCVQYFIFLRYAWYLRKLHPSWNFVTKTCQNVSYTNKYEGWRRISLTIAVGLDCRVLETHKSLHPSNKCLINKKIFPPKSGPSEEKKFTLEDINRFWRRKLSLVSEIHQVLVCIS